MTPQDMEKMCADVMAAGLKTVTFTHAKGTRLPHGFPRGELLSESPRGDINMAYRPGHILNWLRKSALIAAREESK